MKELMRAHTGQCERAIGERVHIHVDGSAVGVLHATPARPFGEVINEEIGLEWTVVHPGGLRRHNAAQHGNNLLHAVVGCIRINYYSIVTSAFVKVSLIEGA